MDLGTRLLTITLDGTDHTAEVSNVRIVSAAADSDFTSFADAASGGARQYTLQMTAKQNTEASSLLNEVWDNAGDTVPVVIAPTGAATPTATEPHWTGNVVITEPDGDMLGGEANASTSAKFTIEVAWRFTAKPAKIVA